MYNKSQQPHPKSIAVFPCILFLFLTFATGFEIYELSQCQTPVQAEFIKYVKTGSGKSSQIRAYYKYDYNGITYKQNTRNSGYKQPERETKGEIYTIYIDSNHPTRCKNIDSNIDINIIFKLAISGLLLINCIIFFKNSKSYSDNETTFK